MRNDKKNVRRDAYILMTRVPQPGKTKTRLLSVLSEEDCCRLHEALLSDLAEQMKPLAADLIVYYLDDTAENMTGELTPKAQRGRLTGEEAQKGRADEIPLLRKNEKTASPGLLRMQEFFPNAAVFLAQPDGGLGMKMARAFEAIFAAGYERAVLTGSDIPELSSGIIAEALSALSGADAVLNPTKDGGYYLVGFRSSCIERETFKKTAERGPSEKTEEQGAFKKIAKRAAFEKTAEYVSFETLFEVPQFSTKDVFRQTLENLKATGCTVKIGAGMQDIDTPEDLAEMRKAYETEPDRRFRHTAAFLRTAGKAKKNEKQD